VFTCKDHGGIAAVRFDGPGEVMHK
jgi:hypothetical protein